jgi:hypothetical protein
MSRARVCADGNGGATRKQDISIRYVGHFDNDLFEEIRKLNPDLKDPDHLEDGQLIRIPLRVSS